MLEAPLSILAPHHCCSCDRIGHILCDHCNYDIISEAYGSCIVCGDICRGGETLCRQHVLPFARAWCVGERSGSLRALLDQYKFEHARSASETLAKLLDSTLPLLPDDIVVVPVPTIRKHIRQRGFDHTALFAQKFARRRGMKYQHAIERITSTTQLGKGLKERRVQAQQAFRCNAIASGAYLLVDDIFTTGATARYAAQVLRDAGATEVWLAIIARQPLEKYSHQRYNGKRMER